MKSREIVMFDETLTAAMASDPSWPAKAVAIVATDLALDGHDAPNTQGSPSDADDRAAYAAYGRAGLIGPHWDPRFGGLGVDPMVTLAIEEQLGYHWLPMSGYLLSVKTIGNAMIQYASAGLCERILPRIAAGELIFCQGFSEPGAGTDLGSLRTTARLDGDSYVVNGHKIWTSSAEVADWVYLAVRTGEPDSRHRGLTVLVADMSTPGIVVESHRTLGGGTIGELTLTDVVIPADQVVGDVNGGWQVLMGTLDYERVTSEKIGVVERLLDGLAEIIDDEPGRAELSRLRGETAAARAHGHRATELLAEGADASGASSMAKLSVALLMQDLATSAVRLLGPRVLIEEGPGALLEGRLAAFRRSSVSTTIAGGVSDIQRRNISRQRLAAAR
jgi:alkylation response protein AidB-like acyl-CoA dehydrogenase